MKTLVPFLFTLLILTSSCNYQGDKNSNEFKLHGKISGQDTGKIVLQYILNNKFVRDTAKIKNGQFIHTGNIPEPTSATLNIVNEPNRVSFYLESGKMRISLSKNKFSEFKMTGSKTQSEYDLLKEIEKPIHTRLSILNERLTKINDSIKNLETSPKKLLLEKRAEELRKQCYEIQNEYDPVHLEFILENPGSYLTPIYLRSLEEREFISIDSVKAIFNGLDTSIRESRKAARSTRRRSAMGGAAARRSVFSSPSRRAPISS
jgi:hypothetical protein